MFSRSKPSRSATSSKCATMTSCVTSPGCVTSGKAPWLPSSHRARQPGPGWSARPTASRPAAGGEA
eukprot:1655760-Heterocapsa_arctica.AAC.1